MGENMNPAEAVSKLRSAGWLSDKEIVRKGITVTDISRSHFVYRLDVGGEPRWIMKWHQPARGDFDGNFERERQAYRLASEIEELAALMPRLITVLGDEVIVTEVLEGATGWRFHGPAKPALLRALATRLGKLHRATQGRSDPRREAVFPWILKAMDFDSPENFWEGVSGDILQNVARYPGAVAALRKARGLWRSICLIHGDTKLDNAIFAANRPAHVILIDWENSGSGDPLWDLAALSLQDVYESTAELDDRGWVESMRKSLAANLAAYTEGYGQVPSIAKLPLFLGALIIQSVCTATSSGQSKLHDMNAFLGAGVELLTLSEERLARLETQIRP